MYSDLNLQELFKQFPKTPAASDAPASATQTEKTEEIKPVDDDKPVTPDPEDQLETQNTLNPKAEKEDTEEVTLKRSNFYVPGLVPP